MKRLFPVLLILALLFTTAACTQEPQTGSTDSGAAYDPTPYLSAGDVSVILPAESASVPLNNGSDVNLSVGGNFTAVTGNLTYTGVLGNYMVEKKTSAYLTLPLADLNLAAGTYTLSLPFAWVDGNGTPRTGAVSCRLTVQADTPDQPQPPAEDRDVTMTQIRELTESEEKKLADYLFDLYIPNCFGVFDSPKDLPSASVWASVYALNLAVEKDDSEQARSREDAVKKAARYYPEATFVPEDVRLFNKETGLFMAVPVQEQKYLFLSYEIREDTITVFYEEIPEDEDQTPGQYATTLKNSEERGFFTFVSTKRVGAVG